MTRLAHRVAAIAAQLPSGNPTGASPAAVQAALTAAFVAYVNGNAIQEAGGFDKLDFSDGRVRELAQNLAGAVGIDLSQFQHVVSQAQMGGFAGESARAGQNPRIPEATR